MRTTPHIRSLVISFALGLAMFSTGCTKFLEFEGDNAQPRLVVNGVFLPDSVFQVEVSNSRGFVDGGLIVPLTTATVTVHDSNGALVDSLMHVGDGNYRSTAVAEAAQSYAVRVSAPGYDEVQATDIAPMPVPILSWDTLSTAGNDEFAPYRELNIFFTFADPGNEENFYLLEVYVSYDYFIEWIYNPQTGEFIPDTIFIDNPSRSRTYFLTSDQVILSENDVFVGDLFLSTSAALFTDVLFNGTTRQFSLKLDYYLEGATIDLRLTSCSRDYFRYVRTLQRYDWVEGDPFAEPVQVFNNIEGGLGIWGGASFSEVKIRN